MKKPCWKTFFQKSRTKGSMWLDIHTLMSYIRKASGFIVKPLPIAEPPIFFRDTYIFLTLYGTLQSAKWLVHYLLKNYSLIWKALTPSEVWSSATTCLDITCIPLRRSDPSTPADFYCIIQFYTVLAIIPFEFEEAEVSIYAFYDKQILTVPMNYVAVHVWWHPCIFSPPWCWFASRFLLCFAKI